MADKPSFFITTPIYYVNAAPHLGTAYCTMLCDVQARYRRAAGYDVKFLTGMDEHGEKVAEAARSRGGTPPYPNHRTYNYGQRRCTPRWYKPRRSCIHTWPTTNGRRSRLGCHHTRPRR